MSERREITLENELPRATKPTLRTPQWLNSYIALASLFIGVVALVVTIGLFVAAPTISRLILLPVVICSIGAILPLGIPLIQWWWERGRVRRLRIQYYPRLYNLWEQQQDLANNLSRTLLEQGKKVRLEIVGVIEENGHVVLVLSLPKRHSVRVGDVFLVINPRSERRNGRVTVTHMNIGECRARPLDARDVYDGLFWGRMRELARSQERPNTDAVAILISGADGGANS